MQLKFLTFSIIIYFFPLHQTHFYSTQNILNVSLEQVSKPLLLFRFCLGQVYGQFDVLVNPHSIQIKWNFNFLYHLRKQKLNVGVENNNMIHHTQPLSSDVSYFYTFLSLSIFSMSSCTLLPCMLIWYDCVFYEVNFSFKQ